MKSILLISNKHHLSANVLLLQEFTILFLLQNGINSDGVLSGDCWTEFLQQRDKFEEMQNINSRHRNALSQHSSKLHTPDQTSSFMACAIATEV